MAETMFAGNNLPIRDEEIGKDRPLTKEDYLTKHITGFLWGTACLMLWSFYADARPVSYAGGL